MLHIVLVAILVTGCSYERLTTGDVSAEEISYAQQISEWLRMGDIGAVKTNLSPELNATGIDQQLVKARGFFPTGDPVEIVSVRASSRGDKHRWRGVFSFQYKFDHAYAMSTVTLSRIDDGYSIKGIQVNELDGSLQDINSFAFTDKPVSSLIFLLLTVGVVCFVVYTLFLCARTPDLKYKWLWMPLIAVGVVGFSLDWTSGQYSLQMFNFYILAVAVRSYSSYTPWIITVSVPFGAVLFLQYRSHIFLQQRPPDTN